MRYIIYLSMLLVMVITNPEATAKPGNNPLADAFHHFSGKEALQNANWTFYVKDVTDGKTLLTYEPDKPVVPASAQKLITTASALMILGHDHQYETLLQHDGYVDDQGDLHGNLYIRGSGDPTLGASMMDDSLSLDHIFSYWHDAITEAGIKTINGHVVADASVFDDEMVPRRWVWEHIGNYFGAGASGLTVHENEYTVFFNAGDNAGEEATVAGTEPEIPGMTFLNEVTTGPPGSGDQVYIFGAPYQQQRQLTGTVPAGAEGFEVRGSMADPPQFLADSLKAFLEDGGITVSGQSMTNRSAAQKEIPLNENRTTLHVWHSPFLFDLLYRTNIESVNTYAENLLKTIGFREDDKGTVRTGLSAISRFWEPHGIAGKNWRLYDGSGLSPSNRVTASQLITIMEATANHRSFPVLNNSLPMAGYSGSLTNQLRGTNSEGVLRAKSGYLNNVRSYAGYTPMENGNLAAFVIIVNDYKGSPATMRNSILHLLDSITRHNGQALH